MLPLIKDTKEGYEMSYEIKGLKTFNGMEGKGYNANLFRDGKKVAEVIDSGDGGMVSVREIVFGEVKRIKQEISGKFIDLGEEFQNKKVPMDVSTYMAQLVEEFEMKKLCRKYTLMRFKGDSEGSYRKLSLPFTPEVKDVMLRQYGDHIIEFINERYL